MWIVFAATSFLLIGALMAAWEEFRAGPVTETRARADRRTSALLYFVNQGLLAPLLAIGLAAIGAAVHPSRSAARWTIAEIAVSFVLFEAVTYAVHRLAHRVPLLFRFHRVHHESADLSWLDAFRQHPVEFLLFQGLGNLPAVLLFGPAGHVSLWINVALRLWTAWLHARGPVSLGSLERVLTSPAMHHAHHDKRRPGEAVSQTCNFGGVLSIFDWLFGTERSKVSPAPVT
jgi:sterol desaturase/sphingolipid hydroxylase (fatty acid hydroxylase superfamily)